tara:strand:+ start:222 stop:518 length:297 start_codon:yes stop_codon:yes gene_type:complete
MLDTNTISTLEGILNEEYPEDKYTIQDGFISNGKDWLGDKPRSNYALAILRVDFDRTNRGVCKGCEEDFHLGNAVFVQGGNGRQWYLQSHHVDPTMGI